MKIGKVVTDLRNKRGMTQDQMADALEVKRPRYNAWENNISKPDIEMTKKIANFHKVPIDYLLGNNESPIPNWATSKHKRDLKKMLEDDSELMFDGVPINQEDRQRVNDVLTGLFWEAKQMNKRKKNTSDKTNNLDSNTTNKKIPTIR